MVRGWTSIYPTVHQALSQHDDLTRQFFNQVKQEQYMQNQSIKVSVCSYNVAGQSPKNLNIQQIRDWIQGQNGTGYENENYQNNQDTIADIVIMGFQEIVPLTASQIWGQGDDDNANQWDQAVDIALNSENSNHNQSKNAKDKNIAAKMNNLWMGSDIDSHEQNSFKNLDLIKSVQSQSQEQRQEEQNDKLSELKKDFINPTSSGSLGNIQAEEQALSPNPSVKNSPDVSGTQTPDQNFELQIKLNQQLSDYQKSDQQQTASSQISPTQSKIQSMDRFQKVDSKRMWGMYLSTWCRSSIMDQIKGFQIIAIPTGVFGYMGNKGALAARFYFNETSIGLMCFHLSAGDSNNDNVRRHSEFQDIVKRANFLVAKSQANPNDKNISFNDPKYSRQITNLQKNQVASLVWGDSQSIIDCKIKIFLGDVNFRIEVSSNDMLAETFNQIKEKQYQLIYPKDQLKVGQRQNLSFSDMKEGEVLFDPTYKYIKNSVKYVGEDYMQMLYKQKQSPFRANESQDLDGQSQTPPKQNEGKQYTAAQIQTQVKGSFVRRSENQATESDFLNKSQLSVQTGGGITRASMPSTPQSPTSPTQQNEKLRTPSWTDRILYKSMNPEDIAQLYYKRQEIQISDHRPICAGFDLKFQKVKQEALKKEITIAHQRAEELIVAQTPKLDITPQALDIGNIEYRTPKSIQFEFTNTGLVPCVYLIRGLANPSKPNSIQEFPNYLRICNPRGFINPGKSRNIVLQVYVSSHQETSQILFAQSEGIIDAVLQIAIASIDEADSGYIDRNLLYQVKGSLLSSFVGLNLQGAKMLAYNTIKPDSEKQDPSQEVDSLVRVFGTPDKIPPIFLQASQKNQTRDSLQIDSIPIQYQKLIEYLKYPEYVQREGIMANGIKLLPNELFDSKVNNTELHRVLSMRVPIDNETLEETNPKVFDLPKQWFTQSEQLFQYRKMVDQNEDISTCEPNWIAALLVLAIKDQPKPLLQDNVTKVWVATQRIDIAVLLLKEQLQPIEWSFFVQIVALLKTYLTEEAQKCNKFKYNDAADLLSHLFFDMDQLVPMIKDGTPDKIIHEELDRVKKLWQNRYNFIQALLLP